VDAFLPELIGTWVAIILTLVVFSYLLGDNVLFRFAEHIFVGVASGYVAVVVFHNVLVAKLLVPMLAAVADRNWMSLTWLAIPLALGLFLFTKSTRRLAPASWLGSLSVAVLLGVGAALAIRGALLGTLLPQAAATANVAHYISRYGWVGGWTSGILVLVGATGSLLHFHFGAGRRRPLEKIRALVVRIWGGLGWWFILIAFGAILATTFMARLSLLIGRVDFLIDSLGSLWGGW
jgi:hypothetical protein